MKRTAKIFRTGLILLAALAPAALSGCKHYRADVVVNPDGSGTRALTLTVQSGSDETFSPASAEFRDLFGVTAQAGWKPIDAGSPDDTASSRGYRRETEIRDVSQWKSQSGDIQVWGAPEGPSRGRGRPGSPGSVRFANTVSLEREKGPDGVIFTYRETFAWTGLLEALVGFYVRNLDANLASGFLDLSAEERGEMRGILSGMLTTWFLQLQVGEDSEMETEDLKRSFLDLADRSLRPHHSDVDRERLAALADTLFDDSEDDLDVYLEKHLPGAHETVFSDIEVHLTLPGRLLENNADEVDGATAVWTIDIWDALARPVEITARSTTAP